MTDTDLDAYDPIAFAKQRSEATVSTYIWTGSISHGNGDRETYKELAFMGMCVEALDEWDPERRARIVRYLADRYAVT